MRNRLPSFRVFLFACTALVSLSTHAQDNFCTGIEKLMKASYNKFNDLSDTYLLEDIGKGVKVANSYLYYSMWKNTATYNSSAEVMTKYKTLVAHLGACTIAGKTFTYTETEKSRLTQIDRVVLDTWSLPSDHAYGKALVEIGITKEKTKYNLTFSVINGDFARDIKSAVDKFVQSVQQPPEQKRQILPFFDAVMRVIESGPEFIGIKGRSMGDGNYESLVQIPGGIRPRVYQPALGEKAWLVDLISTTSEEEANRKYQEIAEQLNTGNWNNIGIMRSNGGRDMIGESTVWEFTNLTKAYEKSHSDFIMELIISKNFRKQWEVYLKIRYDGD